MATTKFYNGAKWFSTSTDENVQNAVKRHHERFGDGITFSVDGYDGSFKTYDDYVRKQNEGQPSNIMPRPSPYTMPNSVEESGLNELRKVIRNVILKEEYDFEIDSDHVPDDYYGQPTPAKPLQGIGKFENIDWQMLHETLVANTEYYKNGKVEANPRYMPYNASDLIDPEEGLLGSEELKKLEDFGLIEESKNIVVLPDEYLDYQAFYNKAKEIWTTDAPIYRDTPSEAPYLRGRETD